MPSIEQYKLPEVCGAVGNSNERRVRDRRKKNGEPISYKREERSKEVTQFGAKPRRSSVGP